jgi:hypothetical protein
MPRNTPTPLPESLQYLQSFLRALSKLLPEELNESVDASRLETALRKRLRGLDEARAQAELSKDRELLETWLKTSAPPDHPGYWILGYLSLPGLARELLRPPEPPPRGPTIAFESPSDWKVKTIPFGLSLEKGKLLGSIAVMDENTLDLLQRQRGQVAEVPGFVTEASDVRFGEVSGKKYVLKQFAPMPWKRVDYYLAVPRGFVFASLDGLGVDFDESSFEAKAHTLRLSAQAS